MPRRTTLLAVLATLLLLAVALPLGLSALDDPEASPPSEVSAAPLATETPTASPPPRPVAVDVHGDEYPAELARQLEAAGFVVTADAPTRIMEQRPPNGPDVLEVHVTAYTYVVHPRAPLYDIGVGDAVAIQALEPGTGLGGPLVVVRTDPPYYTDPDRADRLIEVDTPDEVMDLVSADLTAVGVIPIEALDRRVRPLVREGQSDPYGMPGDRNMGQVYWIVGPDREDVARALGWPTEPREDPVRLVATGELIPARCVTTQVWPLEDGYDAIFDGTRHLLRFADLTMSHWEPAVIDGDPTPCTSTFNLSTHPAAAQAAVGAGIDVALAIGNHMGDCWPGCGYQAAVLESVEHLKEAGLTVTGAGEDLEAARTPALVERDGITFAFLGYDDIAFQHYGATASTPENDGTPGTAHADPEGVADDVRAAKALADHVIVGFSWGVEYTTAPTDRQRALARAAIEAGASLVVGNHPHWVQATEWIGEGFVAYGLGNFVFDQDWSVETTQGAILEAGFTRDRLLGVRLRPTAIRQQHLVELLDPTTGEGAAILQRIWDATDALEPRR